MNFIPLFSSSAGNAYLVTSPGSAPLLLECGVPIKKLREKLYQHGVMLTDLAGCLVSHAHGDHSRAVKDLLKAGVDVCASKSVGDDLFLTGHHRFNETISGKELRFSVSGWRVIPVDCAHDVPCQGFVISAPDGDGLVFIPDTQYVKNRFEGFTHLAVECNHQEDLLSDNIVSGLVPVPVGRRVRRNHMSLEKLIAMLKANDLSRCREIHLLHLSDTNSDEQAMLRAVQEATGVAVFVAGE